MSKKLKVEKAEDYNFLIGDISSLLETARKNSSRAINSILTATYWEIGRRIVEYEYQGKERAEYYGDNLIVHLSNDLQKKFGKGFRKSNIYVMKNFYSSYQNIFQTMSGKSLNERNTKQTISHKSSSENIFQTISNKSLFGELGINKSETPSWNFDLVKLSEYFTLPWSHYVMLIRRVKDEQARNFYEAEATRNGWSVRQLDRQISTQFYERTVLSKNKSEMLKNSGKTKSEDLVTPEEEIKDPFILEFLGLKDEYSENDLEESLILHLEKFLLDLGENFAFVGRQKRLRIGNEWYRIDLLFFHRKCLVVIDLKVGKFTHADAGQMHMYLNYAKEKWTNEGENPPVGLILCAEKDSAIAKYSLEGLPNKIMASEYKLTLPNVKLLAEEIEKTRRIIENRKIK